MNLRTDTPHVVARPNRPDPLPTMRSSRQMTKTCVECRSEFTAINRWTLSRRKYCSQACSNRANNRRRKGEAQPTVATNPAEFWKRVQKGAGCWEWTAALYTNGYGMASDGNRSAKSAHRVAWEFECGPIPDGLFVLHRCDNRKCVRPDHLFLGTKKDNTHDMIRKGRAIYVSHPGEGNPNSTLTNEDVLYIRIHYQPRHWKFGAKAMAERLQVNISTIFRILNGSSWSHLPDAMEQATFDVERGSRLAESRCPVEWNATPNEGPLRNENEERL